MLHPARTAMFRRNPSIPAKQFIHHLPNNKQIISVLDYGCGRGTDIEWFTTLGLRATGYDPAFRPDRTNNILHSKYNYITCFYVLNVLVTPIDRLNLLSKMMKLLVKDGKLFIAVRNKKAIDYVSKNWTIHNDGYITSNNTFQHGFTNRELNDLVTSSDYHYSKWSNNGFVGAIVTHK